MPCCSPPDCPNPMKPDVCLSSPASLRLLPAFVQPFLVGGFQGGHLAAGFAPHGLLAHLRVGGVHLLVDDGIEHSRIAAGVRVDGMLPSRIFLRERLVDANYSGIIVLVAVGPHPVIDDALHRSMLPRLARPPK